MFPNDRQRMDLNERHSGENLGGVKGRGFKIYYVIKKIDIQYNKAQRCNSVDRGLPGMQEAVGSIPSTTQLGVVVHTCVRRWRQQNQKFKVILSYLASLRSAWAT